MQRFTELRVWRRSHQLALDIYRETKSFPRDERFGVVAQIRRAAVSAPCNIAESAKRRRNPDDARLLNIAEGSLAETEALLRLSKDLGFGKLARIDQLVAESEEIARMVNALRASVESEG
jgi:four helix bundle protein